MQKRFAQKIEEMRRLIDGSASVSVGGEGSLSAPQYLLAVSGGMDSMCMADLFLQTLGADAFAIAHCNFSLRGEESDGDEALVREWAENNCVRIFVKRFDTVSYARETGISIEMAARDLRYGWFAQLCQEHGYAALSVAHNANDNAETLLLNLLRGTGLKGLHGMPEISSLSVCGGRADIWSELAFSHPRVVGGGQWRPLSARYCDKNVMLCRPLLEFTRKQIEGYVLTHRVPYRHDSSNFTSDYKRNRVRNEIFPIFEKINPSFIRTLNRGIGYFSEAEQIVSDWCEAQLPCVLANMNDASTSDGQMEGGHFSSEARTTVFCPSDGVTILLSRLLATPHWRYLLYHILEPYGFSSQVLASIEDLLTSDRTVSGKRFESPTHVLLTGRETLTVLPLELEESRPAVSERSISPCSCSVSHATDSMEDTTTSDENNDTTLRLIAYCFENENVPRRSIKEVLKGFEGTDIIVMIGPEGDFSIEEARFALEAGFIPVHLGESRLRTETAALTAAAAVYLHFISEL